MFGIPARRALVCTTALIALTTALLPACLDRPLCSDCEPETTNIFTARVLTSGVDKLDLLFMIDGSTSMADKQDLLEKAVPALLDRFVNPRCVDDQGDANGETSQAGECKRGSAEFPPLKDIHIGVISSSLGSSGGDGCPDDEPLKNDRAWLIPRVRPKLSLNSYQQTGFLAWDPGGTRNTPPGTNDAIALGTDFRNLVDAVDETGCGFEASLESWYRFLIDPDPPEKFVRQGDQSSATGTDAILLEQRAKFLRPDSLVGIVMLTDENDCSLSRSGFAWLTTQLQDPNPDPHAPNVSAFHMPRGTSTCTQNPMSACCRSCATIETTPPAGCVPVKEDPDCMQPNTLSDEEDPVDLRCFNQKRRFGLDLLEPVEKYVRGLTAKTVLDRNGMERPNPLFVAAPNRPARSADLVFLAGIVGVPWQSIATAESLTGPGLQYLTAEQIEQKGVWDLILGDPATGKLPQDPHMIESVAPRTGSHPIAPGATIAPVDEPNPRADVISGHEHAHPNKNDLQFACIFELEKPRDCSSPQTTGGCDCRTDKDVDANSPLCQPPLGGPAGHTQYYAKAYPGIRQLQVLKGLGDQGVVASICPKVVRTADANTDSNYGYNPALDALVASFRKKLVNQCLARAPEVDDSGRLQCVVVEAQVGGTCDCTRPGRSPARAEVLRVLEKDLAKDGVCGTSGGPSCSEVCGCELAPHEDVAALQACRNKADTATQAPGYCYVDPAAGLGDPSLVKGCPGTQKRLLRFVGPDTPTNGAFAYMACMGSNVQK